MIDRSEGVFKLRGLDRNPEHVAGRDLFGASDGHAKFSEWTFKLQLFRIFGERVGSDDERDLSAGSREAGGHQAAHTASAKNGMVQFVRHFHLCVILKSRTFTSGRGI